ncbi:MAG TPA: response regulator transcription factor, partial [Clostridia bacterium]|nr:response regulator transcription factor [Clostridia bacterium]
MFRVMVVEDDTNTRKLMFAVLAAGGYEPVAACDGTEALGILDKKHIDLIVLDIMMPRMDGFALTRELRSAGNNTPILMVTAKELMVDKKQGFLAGTDDYMVKPVDEEELLLRVAALLRRSRIADEHTIAVGGTALFYDSLTLSDSRGRQVLPPKEFMLLFLLLSYQDKIFTRRQLLDELWDMESDTDERTV